MREILAEIARRQRHIPDLCANGKGKGFLFDAEVECLEANAQAEPRNVDHAISQTIRYCKAGDGTRLAYAVSGSGPAMVIIGGWLNHLEFDWESPVFSPLLQELASSHMLVRYNARGTGLSDWDVEDFSFSALVRDLETVTMAAGQQPFVLLGISQGAAIAIEYAAANPDKVTKLILWGGFARGINKRGNSAEKERGEALRTLLRQGWGKQTSAFHHMFAALFLPEANHEQIKWWTDLQRAATSPENAVRLRELIDDIDVSDRLEAVRAPTLIIHSAREEVVPISEARFVGASIPNAQFVFLDSANHFVMHQEKAWHHAVAEIEKFLRAD